MEKLARKISNPVILIISLAVFVLFMAIVLPDQSDKAAQYTPEGAEFDTGFFYSAAVVYDYIDRYSPEGRASYIRSRWTFDLVYPFVYGIFCFSLAGFFLTKLKPGRSRWYLLLLFTILAVVCDLLENTSISIMMAAYPSELPILPVVAALSSGCKWVAVSVALGIAVLLPIIWLIRKIAVRTS